MKKRLLVLAVALLLSLAPSAQAMVSTANRVCAVWVIYTQMGVFFVPICFNTTTCTVTTPCR